MTEHGNQSHMREFLTKGEMFEMGTLTASPDPDSIEAEADAEGENHSHQTEDGNGDEKLSDNDDPAIEHHEVEAGSSHGSIIASVEESDAASTHSNFPTTDDRPEVATFRRRQAQMLPICILSTRN